jgi:hypothetical protein
MLENTEGETKNGQSTEINDLISLQEEFEDTKGVIRIRKLNKDRQQWPKEQTTIYKTLHRKLKIEQLEHH